MSSYNSVKPLWIVVATYHFPNKTWIFISTVFMALRYTTVLPSTVFTLAVITKEGLFTYQQSN
jgi:hypothetical protein